MMPILQSSNVVQPSESGLVQQLRDEISKLKETLAEEIKAKELAHKMLEVAEQTTALEVERARFQTQVKNEEKLMEQFTRGIQVAQLIASNMPMNQPAANLNLFPAPTASSSSASEVAGATPSASYLRFTPFIERNK